jgi:hypothetical protein
MRWVSAALVAALLVIATLAGAWPRSASAGTQPPSTHHVTLVFGHPTRLSVSFYQWSRSTTPNRYVLAGNGTTKDQATIARIVDVLNQVNAPSNMPHSCPSLADGRTVLQFGYSNGDVWTVYEGGCWDFSTHGVIGTAAGDPPVLGTLPQLLKQVARTNTRG